VSAIDAQRVLGYAIFKDGKSTKLSYPLENFLSDVAGSLEEAFTMAVLFRKYETKLKLFPRNLSWTFIILA
jgi:ATP-dependent protease HslVU (ClpYQ) peptidase subunit